VVGPDEPWCPLPLLFQRLREKTADEESRATVGECPPSGNARGDEEAVAGMG
jgi:hypothetical protein